MFLFYVYIYICTIINKQHITSNQTHITNTLKTILHFEHISVHMNERRSRRWSYLKSKSIERPFNVYIYIYTLLRANHHEPKWVHTFSVFCISSKSICWYFEIYKKNSISTSRTLWDLCYVFNELEISENIVDKPYKK